jgi:hypothetical protein
LEYACLLSKDLAYIDEELYQKTNRFVNEVKAMLIGLIKKIKRVKSFGLFAFCF